MKTQPDARLERVLATLALLIIAVISSDIDVDVKIGTVAGHNGETLRGLDLTVSRRNGHIRVGLLERALPPRPRRALIVLQWLCTVIVLGLIAWYGGRMTIEEYQWETLSPGLGLPQWWYVAWLPLLAVLMLLRVTQQTWDRLRGGLIDEP